MAHERVYELWLHNIRYRSSKKAENIQDSDDVFSLILKKKGLIYFGRVSQRHFEMSLAHDEGGKQMQVSPRAESQAN